jgi:hypothetical protein
VLHNLSVNPYRVLHALCLSPATRLSISAGIFSLAGKSLLPDRDQRLLPFQKLSILSRAVSVSRSILIISYVLILDAWLCAAGFPRFCFYRQSGGRGLV